MKAFISKGYDVILLTPNDDDYYYKLINLGYNCIPLIISPGSLSPINSVNLIYCLLRHFKRIKPDLILSFTIKPNIFGAIAAKFSRRKCIPNITGLGYIFIRGGVISQITTYLYKIAVKMSSFIFLQNYDDYSMLKSLNVIRNSNNIKIIPGSGVDLEKFNYKGVNNSSSIIFMYAGRFLWDKGIGELIEAFKVVQRGYPASKLVFIGGFFPTNPAAIKPEELNDWIEAGLVEYHGMVDNVSEHISNADCVILPSYREGMPRSLLEASAMGKPIITVDSVGCRDVVEDGITGFMAKVKDVDSLAQAMIKFIELPLDKKIEMGLNGRRKMEREFDQKIVVNEYLTVVNKLLNN
jgi:glycosyltransferase involved in cell wall biosynthesis